MAPNLKRKHVNYSRFTSKVGKTYKYSTLYRLINKYRNLKILLEIYKLKQDFTTDKNYFNNIFLIYSFQNWYLLY